MTRDELIAALEKASGSSRDLDLHIWCVANDVAGVGAMSARVRWLSNDFPYYTASIDAALTLVPDDACWTISVPRQPDMSGKRYWASIRSNHPGARGSTPPIALCIAALKART